MPVKITISTHGGTGALVDPVFLKETIQDALTGVDGADEVLNSNKLADHKQLNALIQSAVAAGMNLLGELPDVTINCSACTFCQASVARIGTLPLPIGCQTAHDVVQITMEEVENVT